MRAPVSALDGSERLLHVPALRPARGLHTGPAAERRELDPGVVGEHPTVGGAREAAEAGLDPRVVGVGEAVLLRVLGSAEQVEIPVGKERRELRQLVRVAAADGDEHAARQSRGASIASCCKRLQILDARGGEVEQPVEALAVERHLLGSRLHLDELARRRS